MNTKPDVTVILPCYNEDAVFTGSLRDIIQTLSLSRFSFEIIFVDDGSGDLTRERIKRVCRADKRCRYVFHPQNLGRGAAVSSGMREARADIVGYMDIDCEVSPLYIPSFVQILKEGRADIVVGRRVYRTTFSSIIREILSVGYQKITSTFLGTDGVDTESGYKFFNKKAFLPVCSEIRNNGWFWDTESIILSLKKGLSVREEPVLFLRRFDKQSSVRLIPDTLLYLKNVWELYWRFH